MGERLAHDRPPVDDAESLGQLRAVVVRGGGGDPVDHRVRERDLGARSTLRGRVPQLRERRQAAPGDVPVPLDVVAGDDGERGDPPLPATSQRLGEEAERGSRHGPRRQVGLDPLVVGLEATRDRVEVITAFGDRHADDPDARVSEPFDDRDRVVGGEEIVDDRADDAWFEGPVRMLHHERVQVVLGGERLRHGPVRGQDADAADRPSPTPGRHSSGGPGTWPGGRGGTRPHRGGRCRAVSWDRS